MKRVGTIIDGVWKIEKYTVKSGHYYYLVKNIYNGMELEIVDSTLRDIINKKTQISRIVQRRIRHAKFYGREYAKNIRYDPAKDSRGNKESDLQKIFLER